MFVLRTFEQGNPTMCIQKFASKKSNDVRLADFDAYILISVGLHEADN
jgi:hypothetical protein